MLITIYWVNFYLHVTSTVFSYNMQSLNLVLTLICEASECY